jgi:hypothetical protein
VQTIEQNPGKEAQAVESFVRGLRSGTKSAASSQS